VAAVSSPSSSSANLGGDRRRNLGGVWYPVGLSGPDAISATREQHPQCSELPASHPPKALRQSDAGWEGGPGRRAQHRARREPPRAWVPAPSRLSGFAQRWLCFQRSRSGEFCATRADCQMASAVFGCPFKYFSRSRLYHLVDNLPVHATAVYLARRRGARSTHQRRETAAPVPVPSSHCPPGSVPGRGAAAGPAQGSECCPLSALRPLPMGARGASPHKSQSLHSCPALGVPRPSDGPAARSILSLHGRDGGGLPPA